MSDTQQKQFKIGDVVWAKVSGYPWWPAYIHSKSQENINSSSDFMVKFFGDTTHANLNSQKLAHFVDHYHQYEPKSRSSKKLARSVVEAEHYLMTTQGIAINAEKKVARNNSTLNQQSQREGQSIQDALPQIKRNATSTTSKKDEKKINKVSKKEVKEVDNIKLIRNESSSPLKSSKGKEVIVQSIGISQLPQQFPKPTVSEFEQTSMRKLRSSITKNEDQQIPDKIKISKSESVAQKSSKVISQKALSTQKQILQKVQRQSERISERQIQKQQSNMQIEKNDKQESEKKIQKRKEKTNDKINENINKITDRRQRDIDKTQKQMEKLTLNEKPTIQKSISKLTQKNSDKQLQKQLEKSKNQQSEKFTDNSIADKTVLDKTITNNKQKKNSSGIVNTSKQPYLTKVQPKQISPEVKQTIDKLKKIIKAKEDVLQHLQSITINHNNIREILDCRVVEILDKRNDNRAQVMIQKLKNLILTKYFDDQIIEQKQQKIDNHQVNQVNEDPKMQQDSKNTIVQKTIKKIQKFLRTLYQFNPKEAHKKAVQIEKLIHAKDQSVDKVYKTHAYQTLKYLKERTYEIPILIDFIRSGQILAKENNSQIKNQISTITND